MKTRIMSGWMSILSGILVLITGTILTPIIFNGVELLGIMFIIAGVAVMED